MLSDGGGAACKDLGILQENGMAKRTTYLIDRKGVLAKMFADVKIDGHAEEVLAAAKRLQGQ